MGTLMVCAFVQALPPGVACQTVSLARWTTSALIAPPGPGASVAVPGGSAGSVCQWLPAPLMVSPRWPVSTTAAVPSGPMDAEVVAAPWSGSGGESAHRRPSADQAATRLTAGPVPARSSATRWLAVEVSRSTAMCWRARSAGMAGPAACHVPPVVVKMPTAPGRVQVPPSSDAPEGV